MGVYVASYGLDWMEVLVVQELVYVKQGLKAKPIIVSNLSKEDLREQ